MRDNYLIDMTQAQEAIYRRILYVGIVDIRNLSLCASNGISFAPGLAADDCIGCVTGLAEWLHDLAGHARDFSRWDTRQEDFFRHSYESYCQSFPPTTYLLLVHDVMKLLC
ncbi:MAG: hypothetical protein EOO60_09145 [Hymenobacter sp.]|nr:MAG: hypothetical protein EOO60_09145 [Hymenobacter sp.]